MQAFLDFFFTHIEPIIMWLSVVFLIIASGYFIWNQFFRQETEGADPAKISELEEMLKKVLSQAELVTTPKAATPSAAGDATVEKGEVDLAKEVGEVAGGANSEELEKLKSQLSEKEGEIKKLSDELATASGGEPVGTGPLEEKISELEARLAEYEIIEDDIADLSKYKDENARLKDEIEKLKVGGLVADIDPADIPPEEPQPSSEAESVPEEPLPVEAASAESTPSAEAENVVTLEEEPSSSGDPITDDLINEFEMAVNEQTPKNDPPSEKLAEEVGQEVEVEEPDKDELASAAKTQEDALAALAAGTDSPADVEKASNDTPLEASFEDALEDEDDEGGDDILAEFAPDEGEPAPAEIVAEAADTPSENNPPAAEPEAGKATIDTDRMLEEMAALGNVDPNEGDASVLDQELDIEKMASEAGSLTEDKN